MMKSIIKLTIISCLFCGCECKKLLITTQDQLTTSEKNLSESQDELNEYKDLLAECKETQVECFDITEENYLEVRCLSRINNQNEIGFFATQEDQSSLIPFISAHQTQGIILPKKDETYFIQVKRCGDMYWTTNIKSERPEKVITEATTNISYHSLFNHDHQTIHVKGHIRNGRSSNRRENTNPEYTPQNSDTPLEPMYFLDIYAETFENGVKRMVPMEGLFGDGLVYLSQDYIYDLYRDKGYEPNAEFIPVYLTYEYIGSKKVNEISACHNHGDDQIECEDWYTHQP